MRGQLDDERVIMRSADPINHGVCVLACECVGLRGGGCKGVGVIHRVRVRSGCLCTQEPGCAAGVKQWSL